MNRKKQINTTIQIAILVAIVLFANLISGSVFRRIDLTDDGRFTVSKASAKLVEELPKQVFVTIYYGGDLPTYYKNFEAGMQTYLQELALSSDDNIDFQFVNPADDPDIFRRFAEKQLYAFPISAPVSMTAQKETKVLPYAEVSYDQKNVIINLIHNCTFQRPEDGQPDFSVQAALQRFEYNLITTIYNMSREKFKTIGLLTGHGEYPKEAMSDLLKDIDHYYNIINVNLADGKVITPKELDLLMILQPDSALSEREKYGIDQYMMHGGRVIAMMDNEILNFEIGDQASTLTMLRSTNLDDLWSKHGVKLNYDLVKDANCGFISTVSYTTAFGNESRRHPWAWYPIIRNLSGHPISRYVTRLQLRYASTIDTLSVPGVRKTVLMKTSPRSWRKNGQQFINIDQEIRQKPDLSRYVDGGQITGLLLEGNFRSLYEGRPVPRDANAPNPPAIPFKPAWQADQTAKVVLISDGEFATGDLVNGQAMRLPEENKTFMMNLIDYMSGQEIMTALRIRQYHNRMLDPERVFGNEFTIRFVNLGLPLIALLLFGLLRGFLRRRKNNLLKEQQS